MEASGDRVQFADLARTFGSLEAVRGISLEIRAGETFGMLGPNGAGKTTTLSMLATLLPPTRGDVVVFGASVVDDPVEVRRRVGLAPQQISLYPKFTGQENLDFFGTLYGVPPGLRRRRADDLLEMVGLAPRRDDPVATYSGGMQRRLNLACALIHDPRLLLLDEPTAGMAPRERHEIMALVAGIARDTGLTIVFTEHDMDVVFAVATRITVLHQGAVIADGPAADVRADPEVQRVYLGDALEKSPAAPAPARP
jgi:ABC-2 type transport system ATP-binding protein